MEQFSIMVGLDKKNAFEGWFCKIDDKANNLMISIIWGYSTHEDTKHAFIQFTESIKHKTSYVSFPIEELSYRNDPFQLKIGNNFLTEKGMLLDFKAEGAQITAAFRFGEFTPIKKSILKPNIMGWLTYFPNECNHSITSMGHEVDGHIQIGENRWKIREADGYIEKDWGTSFPKEYVWIQANDWENSSVVFSYATVPMLGRYAKGFFLLLHHEGKEYRFSSIEGSRMLSFKVDNASFEAIIKKGKIRVSLKASQAHPISLVSPKDGEMRSAIKESLDGQIHLLVEERGETVVSLNSQRASIDVHFNQSLVI